RRTTAEQFATILLPNSVAQAATEATNPSRRPRKTQTKQHSTQQRVTARHRTKQHPLKLQFSPARHDLGTQAQNTAELLGRGHGPLGSLAVDVEYPREGEDKAGTLLRRHVNFSQSADSKAANSWASRGRARRAPSSPGHASRSTRPFARWLARHV